MRSKHDIAGDGTRAELLRVATSVFAEQGFRETTIRDICRRAGANVASVNYHFGGKKGLYEEVLHNVARMKSEIAATLGDSGEATPEQRLGNYVRAFLGRVLADGPLAQHGNILCREMVEPSSALDRVVEEFMRPEAALLGGLVRQLLGEGFTDEEVRLHSMSVVSQVLFYKHCRPVIERLFPDIRFDAELLDSVARHITTFCLAAFRHVRDSRAAKPKPAGKRRAAAKSAKHA